MKTLLVKRNITIDGLKTSVSLEDAFWTELKNIARTQNVTLSKLVATIDGTREQSSRSSAIRQFVLRHLRDDNKRVEGRKLVPPRGLGD